MGTIAKREGDREMGKKNMRNFEKIANSYQDMIQSMIEHKRAGNIPRAYEIADMVIERAGCELWEVIEAEEMINNVRFGGEDPREVAKTKIAESQWGKPLGQAADNNVEGQILAKQERDNVDAYL